MTADTAAGRSGTTGTGRIGGTLARPAQRLYYGIPDDAADRAALRLTGRVDEAHLVMLAEQGIIPADRAATLLRTVAALAADGYADVLGRPRPRGLYLAYEQAVTRRCGADTGGLLHTGRSRNDLGATTTLLALREHGHRVLGSGVRLLTALLSAARRHLNAVGVIHTHFQPAMPITYGYYLTGIAVALSRDLDRIARTLRSIRRCPLGAHAVAGTDLHLDTGRTAELLGFESGPLHAVDAVASRDVALELLGAAACLATTVTRLGTDLQLWSAADVGLLEFPDWLVGSSSAMPQKRNAFLLEYLKARPGQVVGAWVTAQTATSAAPFTNSIEVGTEAMAPVGPAIATARDVVDLAALVVAGATPCAERARMTAARGFVDATAHANELVRRGVPFREAHERVGAAVLRCIDGTGAWPPEGLAAIDPLDAADRARWGGGPGRRAEILDETWRLRHAVRAEHVHLTTADTQARDRLARAVRTLRADPSPGPEDRP